MLLSALTLFEININSILFSNFNFKNNSSLISSSKLFDTVVHNCSLIYIRTSDIRTSITSEHPYSGGKKPQQIVAANSHGKQLRCCVCVCVFVCVCVCLRPFTVKASSVWNSWNVKEQINDVVFKTFHFSAKSLQHYCRWTNFSQI